LIGARLAVSVTNSAHRKTIKRTIRTSLSAKRPHGRRWSGSQKSIRVSPTTLFVRLAGFRPFRKVRRIKRWLEVQAGSAASILDVDVGTAQSVVFDLSVGSTFLGADPCASETAILSEKIFREMKRAGASVGVGRYDEPRLLYSSPLFGSAGNPTSERRTIHLGIDLFAEQGTTLHAPLDGVVHIVANNSSPLGLRTAAHSEA